MTKVSVKLKLNSGLKKDYRINDLIAQCVAEIKKIHGWEDMKLNQSITKSVMKAVYKESKKIGSGLNKEDIVINTLSNTYNLDESDIVTIRKDIKFILDEGFNQTFFLKLVRKSIKLARNVIQYLN